MFHVVSQDAHGDERGRFVRDKSQDYLLDLGYEYQDSTVLRFSRKLNTCDGDDLIVTVRSNDISEIVKKIELLHTCNGGYLPKLIMTSL